MIITFISQLEDVNVVHEKIVAEIRMPHFALRATFGTLFATKIEICFYEMWLCHFVAPLRKTTIGAKSGDVRV